MTRAYIRLDPAFDERKHAYPDGAYAALIATLCLAEHQPERGRFRSVLYLSRLLGTRGRWVKYLLEMGDIVTIEGDRVYVDGWDEWQEGDVTVKDRMARLRERRRNSDRNSTVTRAVTKTSLPVLNELSGGYSGDISGETYHLLEELTGRTAGQAGERQLSEFDRQFTDHPPAKVEAAYRKAAKAFPSVPTARQLVWAARNILEPFAKPDDIRKLEERERSDAEREASQRRVEATRRRAEELRRASGE